MKALVMPRAAAILHRLVAFGFGVFCIPAIRKLLSGRDIPYVLCCPAAEHPCAACLPGLNKNQKT